MTAPLIRTLFAEEIDRRIEEVIKVDQTDDTVLREELDEYVVTGAIRSHFTGVCETYLSTPNKPHEGIAVWVSGFFGSGKSSFAKFLGLALSSHPVAGVCLGSPCQARGRCSVAGRVAADRRAHSHARRDL
jgi:2-phosphoglycerate kinase